MNENKTLEVLKTGILIERRGYAFYSNCALHATNSEVKRIFEILAEEEEEHIRFLSEQYISYKKNNEFSFSEINISEQTSENFAVIESITANMQAGGYEASAISAALDMENRAIAVYTKQAEEATDPEEKKFYTYLAQWEKGHHKLLFEIDKELKEKVWFDNNFWPF